MVFSQDYLRVTVLSSLIDWENVKTMFLCPEYEQCGQKYGKLSSKNMHTFYDLKFQRGFMTMTHV
jgi:hypothetical protein